MARAAVTGKAVQALVARCHAGLDSMSLQRELVDRLGRVLTVDATFCASVDPATLLFTSAVVREIPGDVTPRFLANEFLAPDVNKFRTLARQKVPVDWLDRITDGRREASPRYREIMAPLGLGDELRAAFRAGGQCWGFLCIHREDTPMGFSTADARTVARVAAHVGEGLQRAMLVGAADESEAPLTPGVLILDEDRMLVATTSAGERWLWELARDERAGTLPFAIEAVLLNLEAVRLGRSDVVPRVRVQTRSGRWVVVHASAMEGPGTGAQVAVVVEPASGADLAPLVLLAYGLTPRETDVAQAALQGKTNKVAARDLGISENTVEDHLKSIFTKVGVGSRGELTARVFSGH